MTKKNISKRERSAIHEASHAVTAELLKSGSVHDVHINPGHGGRSRDSVKEPYPGALVDLAGAAAERILAGKSANVTFLGENRADWGSQSDNGRAQAYIARLGFSREARDRERRNLDIEAQNIVLQAWPAIVKVARALMRHGELGGDDVRAIMQGKNPQPRAAAQAPQRTATVMSHAEMRALQAEAEKRGQDRLARALARSLGDGPPEMERLTAAADWRVIQGGR